MKTKLLLSTVLIACCAFQACEQGEPDFVIPVSARRTVLVYLGTDNNFRAEAAQKIEILRENWNKASDGNLLVYADTGGKPVLVHIYHSERRGNVADTIASYPAENSASPQTLARVLTRAREYRPANSYGLVVLSHATGWLPAEMSDPPRLKAIIQDKGTDESNNYMELSDFAEAIPYKLDFIIFDACFMGAVEVAYELKDRADYIVASPAEVVSPGFVYFTMMGRLFQSQPDLIAVATDFYEYSNNQTGLFRSATVSVVKTAELENLKTVFQGIAGMLNLIQYRNDESTERNDASDIQAIQTFGYGNQKIYFDLGNYIQKIAPERYDEFQTALDKCVVYKAHTDSYYSAGTGTLQPVHTFSGLSVYIPQTAYPQANNAYAKLKWAAPARSSSTAITAGV